METREQLIEKIEKEYFVLKSDGFSDFMAFLCTRKVRKDEIQICHITIRQDKRTKNGWVWGYTESIDFPTEFIKFLK